MAEKTKQESEQEPKRERGLTEELIKYVRSLDIKKPKEITEVFKEEAPLRLTPSRDLGSIITTLAALKDLKITQDEAKALAEVLKILGGARESGIEFIVRIGDCNRIVIPHELIEYHGLKQGDLLRIRVIEVARLERKAEQKTEPK